MSNRIWNLGIALLSLTFFFLLAGFGVTSLHTRQLAGQLKPADPAEPSRLRVGLISQELNNPFWRSVESGARSAAERHGMDLEYAGPLRINAEEQARLLEKAIAKGTDALLVQGLNEPGYARLIDQAAAKGIPVITVDADEPNSKRIAYVGTDNKRAGAQMGELVVRTIGKSGRIGVLLGSKANNQRLRLEGFLGVVNRYPGLAVADIRYSNISRLQAAGEAETMLQQHPELRAIVGFSALDGPGIAEAVQRVGAANVSVFAFDDLETTREAIRQGRIEATIVQQPYQMGVEAVDLVHAYFQGEEIGKLHVTETAVLNRNSLASAESGVGSGIGNGDGSGNAAEGADGSDGTSVNGASDNGAAADAGGSRR